MNPLNRSLPPLSWTQTGVQVPILNELDALSDEIDASKPTRMFSTSGPREDRCASAIEQTPGANTKRREQDH